MTGLGIGLTLVKTLVEIHGGTVDVSSAGLGHGSEFIVRLPIMVESADRGARHVHHRAGHGDGRFGSCCRRQSGCRGNARHAPRAQRTRNAHVCDGLEAVEATMRLRPDVVLLDVGLPRLERLRSGRRIREQHKHPERPVLVAVTGWGQEEDRRRSARSRL